MFFSRKKKGDTLDLGWLGADMHSHLVPGIDDGARELEDALQMLRGLKALGYKKIITTPHILWEVYNNTPERITQGIGDVRAAAMEEGIGVELHAAAEYFIDDHFEEDLLAKKPLLTLSGNMVLVEFSMLTAPMDLQKIIFEMQLQEYQPVIAHPERYTYLARKREMFDELKAAGCFFQLNLLSLVGVYGNVVQELAEYMIKKEYYEFAGTDMHNVKHLELMQKLGGNAQLKRLQDSELLRNHLL
jgi:tyrosine-protein phosphatase YwqE